MPLITPFLDRAYPVAVRGEGSYIYDAEGTSYLDGCSGAVTAAIGHGVDEIVEAMTEQAARISFSYRGQFSNPPAEMLAEELRSQAPGDLDWVFFVNSGSEAMETAQKIAVQYWRAVSYTHLRAHETRHDLVCRLLLEKKKQEKTHRGIASVEGMHKHDENKHN